MGAAALLSAILILVSIIHGIARASITVNRLAEYREIVGDPQMGEIMYELCSGNDRKALNAAYEIIRLRYYAQKIGLLVPHLPFIEKNTELFVRHGQKMELVGTAIQIIKFHQSSSGCPCALYATKYLWKEELKQYNGYSPRSQAEYGNIEILEKQIGESRNVYYTIRCKYCGQIFLAEEIRRPPGWNWIQTGEYDDTYKASVNRLLRQREFEMRPAASTNTVTNQFVKQSTASRNTFPDQFANRSAVNKNTYPNQWDRKREKMNISLLLVIAVVIIIPILYFANTSKNDTPKGVGGETLNIDANEAILQEGLTDIRYFFVFYFDYEDYPDFIKKTYYLDIEDKGVLCYEDGASGISAKKPFTIVENQEIISIFEKYNAIKWDGLDEEDAGAYDDFYMSVEFQNDLGESIWISASSIGGKPEEIVPFRNELLEYLDSIFAD